MRALGGLLVALGLLSGCVGADDATRAGAVTASHPTAAATALYEVFVRDFSAGGDLRGVVEGLDRIEAVGAEVVWLMPIHPIGEVERKGPLGSPYSVRDYRGIHPEFGDTTDFRVLVDAVHARGMRLIMDWVPNHTAWDHDWVTRHPERYSRDEAGEMTVPRGDDGSLTDWTDVVELDYEDAGLRRAMIAEMRYWLEEFGVDGFRVDVAGMVPDAFWREALPELRAAGATLLLAEWGDPRMHDLGFDLTYPWGSYHRLKEAWAGGRAADFIDAELDELAAMPPGALRLRFTTNHDETAWDAPPVTLFGGPAGARAAFVAMALLPGPPLLYNGQEVESPQTLGLFVREPVDWDRPGADEARAFYRAVVDLARTHPSLVGGTLERLETDAPDDVIAYRRGEVVVLVNTRDRAARVTLPALDPRALDDATELLRTPVGSGDVADPADPADPAVPAVMLPAYGAVVLEVGAGG